MKKYAIKRMIILGMIIGILAEGLSGCGKKEGQHKPVTLTVWHVYGGQTDSPLNDMIEEFNDTAGAEKGIKLQVTVVSNTNNIHDAVLRAANDEPGASELPDMFISYPKTILAMPDADILVDYRDYFRRRNCLLTSLHFWKKEQLMTGWSLFLLPNLQKLCLLTKRCLTAFLMPQVRIWNS